MPRSIRREELDDLRDTTGRVAVKCEFCSTEYACDDRDRDRFHASAARAGDARLGQSTPSAN